MEIERKWVVNPDHIKELKKLAYTSFRVDQYYLSDKNDTWTIRLRRANDDCYLTLKNKGLLSREEIEFEISKAKFLEYVKHAKTHIRKIRYIIEWPDKFNVFTAFEVDVYDLYEFITAEVEFNSEEEANNFVAPDWCIKDVTMDATYKNVNLAR